jgi:hypothetical protein
MSKPKVIKDFTKLDEDLQEQILDLYPNGYQDSLILFTDKDGKYIHALPYETEDRYYLLRMPLQKSKKSTVENHEDLEEEEEENHGYTDLDTMQIGGNKKNDEDEEYD